MLNSGYKMCMNHLEKKDFTPFDPYLWPFQMSRRFDQLIASYAWNVSRQKWTSSASYFWISYNYVDFQQIKM